jgi:hypothetical protein
MEQEFAGMVHTTEGTPEPELDNLGCSLAVAGCNSDRILDCNLLAVGSGSGSGIRIVLPVDRSHPADCHLRLSVLQNKIGMGKETITDFKSR